MKSDIQSRFAVLQQNGFNWLETYDVRVKRFCHYFLIDSKQKKNITSILAEFSNSKCSIVMSNMNIYKFPYDYEYLLWTINKNI